MQPKLAESLERLKYINRHPYKFDKITVPILICYMKLTVEGYLEYCSMLVTAIQVEPMEVVLNYIALIVVS